MISGNVSDPLGESHGRHVGLGGLPERFSFAGVRRACRAAQGDDDVCTCGIVVAEVFQGLRRDDGRDAIRRSFEDLIFLEPPGIRLYLRAAELYRALREKGRTVRSTVDCIIAAIAEDGGCALLARDRDMDAILDSGLVKAARWKPASTGR